MYILEHMPFPKTNTYVFTPHDLKMPNNVMVKGTQCQGCFVLRLRVPFGENYIRSAWVHTVCTSIYPTVYQQRQRAVSIDSRTTKNFLSVSFTMHVQTSFLV
jgi:hypothetical protein